MHRQLHANGIEGLVVQADLETRAIDGVFLEVGRVFAEIERAKPGAHFIQPPCSWVSCDQSYAAIETSRPVTQ